MFKIAAIVGGILLLAGVALAGTVTSLGSTDSRTPGTVPPLSVPTTERGHEARGRAEDAGEDLRGPCDETGHANDPCGSRPVTVHAETRGHDAGDDYGGRSGRGEGGGPGHGDDD